MIDATMFGEMIADDPTFDLLAVALAKRVREYAAEVAEDGDGEVSDRVAAEVTTDYLRGLLAAGPAPLSTVEITDGSFSGVVTVTRVA